MSSDEESDLDSFDEEEEEEEELAEDEKIKASKKVPSDIEFEDQVFDVTFHPTKEVVAVAEISGKISIYSYSEQGNKRLFENTQHAKACRNVTFSTNGERLYSCSKDKSIQVIDLNTGSMVTRIEAAHKKPINCVRVFGEHFIVSGSDDGAVKMWDTRTFMPIAEFCEFNDYISDMVCDKDNKYMLCTSGDGVLSVLNLRKKEVEHASDQLEEELLCVTIIKNGTKVACGSGDGVLNIYNWGQWGDISDRVPMEKDSIDSLCKLTEDIVVTGVGNGNIKCSYVHPHKSIGCIGSHGKMGIESLSVSRDGELLATSAASENTVKFWDVSQVDSESQHEARHKENRKRKLDADDDSKKRDFFDGL